MMRFALIKVAADLQNVRLMMMLCGPKCALMSHWSLTNSAVGVPYDRDSAHISSLLLTTLLIRRGLALTQASVFTVAPAVLTSAGTVGSLRDQNQTLMNVDVRSIA